MMTSTLWSVVVFISVSITAALCGLLWARRLLSSTLLDKHHETAGFLLSVVGVVYAVLLAFVMVIVWERFYDASRNVSQEANQLGDLWRMAGGFQPEIRGPVRGELTSYGTAVIQAEWPAMAARRDSPEAWEALAHLWDTYTRFEPQGEGERVLYAESLHTLNELSDNRRERLHDSTDHMPAVLWAALYGGAAITVGFTYLFQLTSLKLQVFMTSGVVGLIALVLFLVIALSSPFRGAVRIGPEPFLEQLARMAAPSGS
jgi:hypothetical protein